ncbi:C1 family peptidase, partial [Calditrichota bacterium]
WEYVEKARRFVREHGDSHFAEGGLGNHFPFIWKVYGIVPAKDYTGLKENQPFHDHSQLFEEMESYLNYVKENNAWNEDQVIQTIKSILNYHIGEPPSKIVVDGKKMTPLEYFKNVVKIDFDDYVDVMSLMEKPYGQKAEYEVPDNWWRSEEYYNVELDKFVDMIKKAIKNGYTLYIGGDTGEPGYYAYKDVAMVPTFDIPSEYIDENARQFRFCNESTTDDHGIHIVGYKEKDGKYWFLIKDSGSGSRNGANKGYNFYHEDYIKLKIMNFTVHKDAVKGFIDIK